MWDDQGREYLDLLAGFGSVNIGHNHPRLVARLHALLDEQPLNLSHTGPSPHAARLAEALAAEAGGGLDMSLFCTGGAEAVEAAIKAARAATRRTRIVFCEGAYHGLSLGTLSVSGSKRMRGPFEPLLPSCDGHPVRRRRRARARARPPRRGDVPRRARADRRRRSALRLRNYLRAGARALHDDTARCSRSTKCRRASAAPAAMFAFQQDGVVPDLLILGKSLGGSIAAVGVTMTTRDVQRAAYGSMRRFDLHGSTFAGNAFACGRRARNAADRGRRAASSTRSRDHGASDAGCAARSG